MPHLVQVLITHSHLMHPKWQKSFFYIKNWETGKNILSEIEIMSQFWKKNKWDQTKQGKGSPKQL